MADSANVKKIIQISEMVNTPIHVPVVFGNECFIVTQQDVRKIEDSRIFTYSKLSATGELIPMDSCGHDSTVRDAIFNASKLRMQLEQNVHVDNIIAQILEKYANAAVAQQLNCIGQQNQAKASIMQQIEWEKFMNSSKPFPLSYSKKTSTSELAGNQQRHSRFYKSSCCGTDEQMTLNASHEINRPLSAKQKLKFRKMQNDFDNPTN